MKKTLNINLAGYPFTIDDDAYNLLKDYLDTIRYAFDTNEDTSELASDIESRIAELLLEKENGGFRIVSLDEISKVIERIGNPSDFIEVEEIVKPAEDGKEERIDVEVETETFQERVTPPNYDSKKYSRNPFVRKRIFRDPQNSMLGGVCSGVAMYLGIDVTVVRLITVLLFFLSATTVAIVYIILWIVVPEARTPYQRMQMMGEDPTVENIGKTVTESFQDKERDPQNAPVSTKSGFSGFLNIMFSIFVKFLIVLGLLICVPLIVACGAGLIACVIAIIAIGVGILSGGMFDSTEEGLMVFYILLAVVGGLITLGIPLWLFIRNFWKKKDVNYSSANRRSMLLIWLCGIALLAVFTVKAVKKGKQIDRQDWALRLERLENMNINGDEIEKININPGGVTIQDNNGQTIKITPGGVSIKTETNDSVVVETEGKVPIVAKDTVVETTKILEILKDSL